MPKKILILCSSPNKKGNTNTVVGWIAEGIKATGGKVRMVDTSRLTYKAYGCTACMGCQKSKKFECVIKDQASPILASIPEYDALVLATPLYFFGPTAQLKVFTDRMYSLFKFDNKTGRVRHQLTRMRFALVATAGSDMFSALEQTFQIFAKYARLKFTTLFIPHAGESGDLKKLPQTKKKAFEFGRALEA
ncbi:MAG: flavodoxin family protein [Candidatus Omnitrophota bacterium]